MQNIPWISSPLRSYLLALIPGNFVIEGSVGIKYCKLNWPVSLRALTKSFSTHTSPEIAQPSISFPSYNLASKRMSNPLLLAKLRPLGNYQHPHSHSGSTSCLRMADNTAYTKANSSKSPQPVITWDISTMLAYRPITNCQGLTTRRRLSISAASSSLRCEM